MSLLITNIKELLQIREATTLKISGRDMKTLPSIKNAYLYIENDVIVDFGKMKNCNYNNADEIIDASEKIVLPTWCDSHTHIVYAGNREQEFVDRINGLSYEDIANRGGGILNSAEKLQNTTEDDLYNQSIKRLHNIIKLGTVAQTANNSWGSLPVGGTNVLCARGELLLALSGRP